MSEENSNQVVEPVHSKIFPTCIKYETTRGNIEEVWVKQADLMFLHDVDDDGEPVDNRVTIQIVIEDAMRDIVVQRYASTF